MRGAGECPGCGASRNIEVIIEGKRLAVCSADECNIMWEPFDPLDLLDKDDEYSSFKEMCSNCAFRPGSPERQDEDGWKALLARLDGDGAAFMCHKGLPLVSDDPEQSHAHPKTPDGNYDVARSRYCRGWLIFKFKRTMAAQTFASGRRLELERADAT